MLWHNRGIEIFFFLLKTLLQQEKILCLFQLKLTLLSNYLSHKKANVSFFQWAMGPALWRTHILGH